MSQKPLAPEVRGVGVRAEARKLLFRLRPSPSVRHDRAVPATLCDTLLRGVVRDSFSGAFVRHYLFVNFLWVGIAYDR